MTKRCPGVALAVVVLVGLADPVHAFRPAGRLGIHAVRLEATGDADELSEPSWGGGVELVVAIPAARNLVAVALGGEIVNFDSETAIRQEDEFTFRRELRTSQQFGRIILGVQVGPHGRGFFQPYAGVHGALVSHSIHSTLTMPDDADPDNTFTQEESQSDWGVGYDAVLGTNLNFYNRFGVFGGVKYQQSFHLEQPLDFRGEMRTIDPEYFEIFFGLSLDLGFLAKTGDGGSPGENEWD